VLGWAETGTAYGPYDCWSNQTITLIIYATCRMNYRFACNNLIEGQGMEKKKEKGGEGYLAWGLQL
jgi:hypothetical protein